MSPLPPPSPPIISTKKRKETVNLALKNHSKKLRGPLISSYLKLRIWKYPSKITTSPLKTAYPLTILTATLSNPQGKASKSGSPLLPHKITQFQGTLFSPQTFHENSIMELQRAFKASCSSFPADANP
jgi:hypothetical protein